MSEFAPINTQEELDNVIKDRLKRQEAQIRGEYQDYAELKKQSESWKADKEAYEKEIEKGRADLASLDKKYSEAAGKIAQYETDALKTKAAMESGLPMAMIGYLKGTTEEEIRKSAEELGKFAKGGQTAPLADPEGDPPKDGIDARKNKAYKDMLKDFKGE